MTTKPLNPTWKDKLRSFFSSPFIIRRIVGDSMVPSLKKDQLILVTSFRKAKKGNIVVASIDGREVVKRIIKLDKQRVWLEGDNENASTDSRHYGWIDSSTIRGVVIYPLRK